MAFKDRLVEARKKKGLTQEELSKEINCSVSVIKKWEKGTSSPNGDWQAKIMNALGVDANFLYQDIMREYEWTPEDNVTTRLLADTADFQLQWDREQALIDSYRELNDEYKELILDMVKRLVEINADLLANKLEPPSRIPESWRTISIPFYPDRPSAGTGSHMYDEQSPFTVQVKETRQAKRADFVLQVEGNSMEPRFRNDDFVLIKKQDVVENGEIGIFLYDGQVYIKQLKDDLLHSLNPEYDDIQIDGEIVCFGKVLGKAEL